jgi:pimeloyl-ACP methyl ester carboxylesterase
MKYLSFILVYILFSNLCDAQKVEKGFAEINSSKLYYEVVGKGTPLILIHGFSFDSRCWRDQVPALKKNFKVVTYDLRGFGKSSLPVVEEQYSHTQDLIELLNFLSIDQAVILGHSYGGKIAIDFTFNHQHRVIGLVLTEAAMNATNLGYEVEFKELMDWLKSTRMTVQIKGIEEAKEVWLNGSPFLPAINNKNSASIVKKMVQEYSGWHWINKDSHIGFRQYPVEKLEEIKVPTLIMYGELSPIGYYRLAQVQNEHISNSQLVKISGAAHALNIENPNQFNAKLLNFLNRL